MSPTTRDIAHLRLLVDVEHCGGEPEQADTGILYHLMSDVTHQVNHPPTWHMPIHLPLWGGGVKSVFFCFFFYAMVHIT